MSTLPIRHPRHRDQQLQPLNPFRRTELYLLFLLAIGGLAGCGQNLEDKNSPERVSTGHGVIYDRGGLTNPAAGDASNKPEWPVRPGQDATEKTQANR